MYQGGREPLIPNLADSNTYLSSHSFSLDSNVYFFIVPKLFFNSCTKISESFVIITIAMSGEVNSILNPGIVCVEVIDSKPAFLFSDLLSWGWKQSPFLTAFERCRCRCVHEHAHIYFTNQRLLQNSPSWVWHFKAGWASESSLKRAALHEQAQSP